MNMLSSMDMMVASFTQRGLGAYGVGGPTAAMESINANFIAQGLGGGGMFDSMNANFAVGLGARSTNYELGQMWPMLISGLLGLLSGSSGGGCPQQPQQPQNWLPAYSEPQPTYSEPSPQVQIGPVSQQVNVSNTNSTVINNNVTNNVTINPARPYPVEFQGQIGFTPDDGKTIVLPGIGMTGTRTVDNPFYGKPLPTDIAGRVGIDQFGNGLKITMAEVMAT